MLTCEQAFSLESPAKERMQTRAPKSKSPATALLRSTEAKHEAVDLRNTTPPKVTIPGAQPGTPSLPGADSKIYSLEHSTRKHWAMKPLAFPLGDDRIIQLAGICMRDTGVVIRDKSFWCDYHFLSPPPPSAGIICSSYVGVCAGLSIAHVPWSKTLCTCGCSKSERKC